MIRLRLIKEKIELMVMILILLEPAKQKEHLRELAKIILKE